ncbi:Acetamidase/Formamidase [Planococcus donghaensis MPA1U2]|uniref:Acetamidase/Formamidase n=1 Tax=Planococcus donghaensis MPA1U2 TaxID=933115 RepID=E7RF20_9BACL|nr:acetamidase/formamidase family protein [Planococcus donghaensis]EGA90419.1 Acetamidase/Formamidase [Planococcus donghaensis MPA1U2]
MIHSIPLNSNHLHSSFNRHYQPILTVNSGDSIQLKTIDIEWGYSAAPHEKRTVFTSRENEEKLIHPIIGPIAIDGAKPGMVLEVRINKLVPGWYGRNWAGGIPAWQNDKLDITKSARIQLDWILDAARMTGSCKIGRQEFKVGLSPFLGLMAVAPGEPGTFSTKPPSYFGGNIDCKELVPGSSLFLPISVEGALFSLGDGHALQGDGEISGTAIECPMDLVDITLILHKDMKLSMPRANTPAGWITFGFDKDLNEAAAVALAEMVSFMEQLYGITRTEATVLSSVAVDLRVTQVVNDVKGIHAILPHGVLR